MSISGKVAIVTGSSRGIGAASAIHLAKQGAKVILNYVKNKQAAEQTKQTIIDNGGTAIIVQADVMTKSGADSLAEAAMKQYGAIDILVSNAGPLFQPIPFEKMTWEDLETNINQDMRAAFFSTKAVLGQMKESHYGRIIYIGSASSTNPTPGLTHHGTSRAALTSLATYVAKEMASYGITANVVSPGMVQTDRTKQSGDIVNKMAAFTPVGRIATPDDVAQAVCFLADNDTTFYTGVNIPVNGGLTMG